MVYVLFTISVGVQNLRLFTLYYMYMVDENVYFSDISHIFSTWGFDENVMIQVNTFIISKEGNAFYTLGLFINKVIKSKIYVA